VYFVLLSGSKPRRYEVNRQQVQQFDHKCFRIPHIQLIASSLNISKDLNFNEANFHLNPHGRIVRCSSQAQISRHYAQQRNLEEFLRWKYVVAIAEEMCRRL
jgi:hypothetical protein